MFGVITLHKAVISSSYLDLLRFDGKYNEKGDRVNITVRLLNEPLSVYSGL